MIISNTINSTISFNDQERNSILSHNKTCFQCNIAITNFLVSHTFEIRPHDYKSFFMLSSAEHGISMLDKSHLINFLEELLIYTKFHCLCLSNQTFKFNFSYTLKHQWDFKVWAQTQLSTDSSFVSMGPGFVTSSKHQKIEYICLHRDVILRKNSKMWMSYMTQRVCFGPLLFNLIGWIQLCDKKNLTFVDCWDKILLTSCWKMWLTSPKVRLTLSSIYTHFNTLKKKALGKHCGKRWNCSKWAISHFSTMFSMQNVFKILW